MCGILGSINLSFNDEHLTLLKHRGPDDSGSNEFRINENIIRLAQRRLSILDLSDAGHQPMISPCEQYAIIFNGEIYNHLELRGKLPRDIPYKGHCDTETILYYLQYKGIEAIKDFNGIFSLAFLDIKAGALTLARDPFGVKPLYYQFNRQSLVFSSEIGPISQLMGPATLDEDGLATLLRLRFNPAPLTLHHNILKLKPGHRHTFRILSDEIKEDADCFISTYPKPTAVNFKTAVKDYGDHLEQAVKRQLLSDVDVGVFLSGGVDSAVVSALASRHYPGRLKAFTVGFVGAHQEDEIDDAAETARVLGLDHLVRKVTFTDFLTQLENCTKIVEEPLATTSIFPMYYLADLAAQHVKVIMTGQGADEPLSGYKKYMFEVVRQTIPSSLRGLAASLLRKLNSKNENVLRAGSSMNIVSDKTRFLKVAEIFDENEILRLTGIKERNSSKLLSYMYDCLSFPEGLSAAEKMMAIDARFNLADDLLNYTDKISMHFSIECRVPMLDLELVQFIQSLPLKTKIRGNVQKRIHKAYAEKLLPAHIVHRTKKGFQSPTRIWFQKESSIIKDILFKPHSPFKKWFKEAEVTEIIDQHKAGYNKEKQIFLLLAISYWMDNNI